MKKNKTLLLALMTAVAVAFGGIVKAQFIPPSCNFGSNVIPCPGFILGQENAGSLGSFTGSEEWSAIGKAPFPLPGTGDLPYGIRIQRNGATALHQITLRSGTTNTWDAQLSFGNVITGPSATKIPPFNRMDFNFVQQNNTVFPPTIRTVNIMTLNPATSKQVTPTGLTAICVLGSSPCFGRVGIENTNPSFTLDVNGIARSTGFIVTSDARYKKDIETIENGMAVVNNLRGTTYEFQDSEQFENIDFASGLRSGFIAQEIEAVLPHTVYTDDNGYKSVDYIAVIPYLVEGLKELSTEQTLLQTELAELRNQLDGSSKATLNGNLNNFETATLFQNTPNPFSQNTEISYFLPETTGSASLLIFDMNGTQLRVYDVAAMGNGSVTIDGSALSAGMYFYTLVADGQEVSTKRMILTK